MSQCAGHFPTWEGERRPLGPLFLSLTILTVDSDPWVSTVPLGQAPSSGHADSLAHRHQAQRDFNLGQAVAYDIDMQVPSAGGAAHRKPGQPPRGLLNLPSPFPDHTAVPPAPRDVVTSRVGPRPSGVLHPLQPLTCSRHSPHSLTDPPPSVAEASPAFCWRTAGAAPGPPPQTGTARPSWATSASFVSWVGASVGRLACAHTQWPGGGFGSAWAAMPGTLAAEDSGPGSFHSGGFQGPDGQRSRRACERSVLARQAEAQLQVWALEWPHGHATPGPHRLALQLPPGSEPGVLRPQQEAVPVPLLQCVLGSRWALCSSQSPEAPWVTSRPGSGWVHAKARCRDPLESTPPRGTWQESAPPAFQEPWESPYRMTIRQMAEVTGWQPG